MLGVLLVEGDDEGVVLLDELGVGGDDFGAELLLGEPRVEGSEWYLRFWFW